jgi:hypothetical protein
MAEKMRHENLADNLKRALRSAADRYGDLTEPAGHQAAIFDVAIVAVPGEHPRAELRTSDELVIDLGNSNAVFIPRLAQLGILFAEPGGSSTGYAPATAKKFVAGITQDVSNKNEAYKRIEPYYKAVINLFR